MPELTDEQKAELREFAQSGIALDLYLVGLQSGYASALIKHSHVSVEQAKRITIASIDNLRGDPIALQQIRDQLGAWITGDHPGGVAIVRAYAGHPEGDTL